MCRDPQNGPKMEDFEFSDLTRYSLRRKQLLLDEARDKRQKAAALAAPTAASALPALSALNTRTHQRLVLVVSFLFSFQLN